jgi:ribosomal protein S13
MSEFSFFRFKSTNMLTRDEEQHKDEIINLTEEILESKGIECDSRIAKISEEQLREILEEVRKLRRKRKKVSLDDGNIVREVSTENEEREQQQEEKEEVPYIR